MDSNGPLRPGATLLSALSFMEKYEQNIGNSSRPTSQRSEETGGEKEHTYTNTHTNTHLKIVQCKKATELFISSNTLLQIVKSLKNVAYLVFVMI